jgi:hypothetical protein
VPQVCHLSAGKGEVISLLDSPLRGRNTFRGRAFHNFDFAIIKDTNFGQRNKGERLTLQFRAEFFNVFNLVNFGLTWFGAPHSASSTAPSALPGRSNFP